MAAPRPRTLIQELRSRPEDILKAFAAFLQDSQDITLETAAGVDPAVVVDAFQTELNNIAPPLDQKKIGNFLIDSRAPAGIPARAFMVKFADPELEKKVVDEAKNRADLIAAKTRVERLIQTESEDLREETKLLNEAETELEELEREHAELTQACNAAIALARQATDRVNTLTLSAAPDFYKRPRLAAAEASQKEAMTNARTLRASVRRCADHVARAREAVTAGTASVNGVNKRLARHNRDQRRIQTALASLNLAFTPVATRLSHYYKKILMLDAAPGAQLKIFLDDPDHIHLFDDNNTQNALQENIFKHFWKTPPSDDEICYLSVIPTCICKEIKLNPGPTDPAVLFQKINDNREMKTTPIIKDYQKILIASMIQRFTKEDLGLPDDAHLMVYKNALKMYFEREFRESVEVALGMEPRPIQETLPLMEPAPATRPIHLMPERVAKDAKTATDEDILNAIEEKIPGLGNAFNQRPLNRLRIGPVDGTAANPRTLREFNAIIDGLTACNNVENIVQVFSRDLYNAGFLVQQRGVDFRTFANPIKNLAKAILARNAHLAVQDKLLKLATQRLPKISPLRLNQKDIETAFMKFHTIAEVEVLVDACLTKRYIDVDELINDFKKLGLPLPTLDSKVRLSPPYVLTPTSANELIKEQLRVQQLLPDTKRPDIDDALIRGYQKKAAEFSAVLAACDQKEATHEWENSFSPLLSNLEEQLKALKEAISHLAAKKDFLEDIPNAGTLAHHVNEVDQDAKRMPVPDPQLQAIKNAEAHVMRLNRELANIIADKKQSEDLINEQKIPEIKAVAQTDLRRLKEKELALESQLVLAKLDLAIAQQVIAGQVKAFEEIKSKQPVIEFQLNKLQKEIAALVQVRKSLLEMKSSYEKQKENEAKKIMTVVIPTASIRECKSYEIADAKDYKAAKNHLQTVSDDKRGVLEIKTNNEIKCNSDNKPTVTALRYEQKVTPAVPSGRAATPDVQSTTEALLGAHPDNLGGFKYGIEVTKMHAGYDQATVLADVMFYSGNPSVAAAFAVLATPATPPATPLGIMAKTALVKERMQEFLQNNNPPTEAALATFLASKSVVTPQEVAADIMIFYKARYYISAAEDKREFRTEYINYIKTSLDLAIKVRISYSHPLVISGHDFEAKQVTLALCLVLSRILGKPEYAVSDSIPDTSVPDWTKMAVAKHLLTSGVCGELGKEVARKVDADHPGAAPAVYLEKIKTAMEGVNEATQTAKLVTAVESHVSLRLR